MSTLSEVADRVGVSQATVSRVLNNKPGVSAATRDLVLAALDVMGYDRPSRLQDSAARTVGLVVPDITNPIFASMASAIGARLAVDGFALMLGVMDPHGQSASESEYINLLLRHQVSGIILTGGAYHSDAGDSSVYAPLADRAIPTVMMNAPGQDVPFATVSCDDQAAATMAWRHLRSLGHERIGMVLGRPQHLPSLRKLQAVTRLATAEGVRFTSRYARHTDHSVETAHMQAADLIEREGITGLICTSDLQALGAIQAGERLGLRTPGDLSVIGYDDSLLMAYTAPPLTTIRQPVTAMSSAAVRVLIEEITGTDASSRRYLFQPELIVRGSTGPAPE